jgi:hypothetical protein
MPLKFTALHITVFGLLIALIEGKTNLISSFLSFSSEYVFWFGVCLGLIGFFSGMLEVKK